MPTSRGRRRPAHETRDAIRAVALKSFLLNGYESTTLEQIAEQLDMTRPAVLYHFKSKEALLAAIVDPPFAALNDLLDTLPVVASPTTEQRAFAVSAMLDRFLAHRCAVALIVRFTTANTLCDIGSRARTVNARAALALSGTTFETDPATQVRTVAALSAMTAIMASRLPVDLTGQIEREALTAGVLAMLDA